VNELVETSPAAVDRNWVVVPEMAGEGSFVEQGNGAVPMQRVVAVPQVMGYESQQIEAREHPETFDELVLGLGLLSSPLRQSGEGDRRDLSSHLWR
jgi:hypothetical protein